MNENTAKMILVIDRPESCEECPLRSYSNLELICTPMRKGASDVECPLKPTPEKKQHGEEIDYEYICIDGWNACLEELEK